MCAMLRSVLGQMYFTGTTYKNSLLSRKMRTLGRSNACVISLGRGARSAAAARTLAGIFQRLDTITLLRIYIHMRNEWRAQFA